MDERELDKQPEEQPREQDAESTGEPQASQADSTRTDSAELEQAEEVAESKAPEEILSSPSGEDAAESLPVKSLVDAEPSSAPEEQQNAPAEEEPQASELSHEQRDALVSEAPPSELSGLLASEAAEEEAEPDVAPSRPSSERRTGQLPQGEVPPEASTEPAWYVIHCYSGYENKVRHNLEQRIETMGMKDKIFDVVIPTQEEIEVREGKRRTVERHIFPGYVLVNMSLSEESWYVVRNTPGVTGFVGMGNLPTALRPEEVSQIIKRMEADAPTVKVSFKEGERVRIIDGPFNDFRGTVSEIDMERTKVRVMVSFFGRETPVELDFLQVEKA
jgi:transcription termination/antitermination protein NusG